MAESSTVLLCLFSNTPKEISSPGYEVDITFISTQRLIFLTSKQLYFRGTTFKITGNTYVFEVDLENFESDCI